MKKILVLIAFLALMISLVSSCKNEAESAKNSDTIALKKGMWRAVLEVQDGKELPFIFEYRSDASMVIRNAKERIVVTDISIKKDSISIQTPVFEGVFKGKIISENLIKGNFIKASLDRVMSFEMNFGDVDRFNALHKPSQNVGGSWETVFSSESDDDRYIAKGIFQQKGNEVTGTFRTTTGDYRYLEGVMDGDLMRLSTFDGAHAFLFEATVSDSTMTGVFYSGNHWQEPFVAKRNENYELPSEESLTYLKEGYDKFAFSFPDSNGELISLSDERYKDKVVIIQIMGTWCPNCLDETKYYAQFYNSYKNEDIEFVALAFEYAKTEEKAFLAINRLKEIIGVPYPILLAQYGTSNKKKANEKLPMLNHILSYPTTIFIDKRGTVRKIHTGFNGPATGGDYVEFKQEFEGFIEDLLGE